MTYEVEYDEDGAPEAVRGIVTVPAEYFSCSNCHLILDRYELIEQANLPVTFEAIEEDPEWPEPEYGND